MWEWIGDNADVLGFLLTLALVAWGAYQYISIKRAELRRDRFDTFHALVTKLVSTPPGQAHPKLDEQRAALFELRNYPEYYDFTLRTLDGIRPVWDKPELKRGIDELDLTVTWIKGTARCRIRRAIRKLCG